MHLPHTLKDMRRKILTVFVILLAAIFVLCMAYAAALHAKRAELASKETSGQIDKQEETPTTVPHGSALSSESETTAEGTDPEKESELPETTASNIAEPIETTEPVTETVPLDSTAATQATEPPREETQPSTQETTEATEEPMDPNELPIIPNV
jgi:cytoskeletal protein RodZ